MGFLTSLLIFAFSITLSGTVSGQGSPDTNHKRFTSSKRSVERSEVYFRRHGGKTVFFGRWLPVLRVTAAWMAGASHMEWRRFAVFNALGGIGWAISISSLGYFAGKSADSVVGVLGILALVIVTLALVSHWWFRRLGRTAAEEPQP